MGGGVTAGRGMFGFPWHSAMLAQVPGWAMGGKHKRDGAAPGLALEDQAALI